MRLPIQWGLPSDLAGLGLRTNDALVKIAQQVNGISEGTNAAFHNAQTSAPTTGTYAQGDFIRNSTPSEAGTAPNKYVVLGWVCSVSGTPGTWLQCRVLTGN